MLTNRTNILTYAACTAIAIKQVVFLLIPSAFLPVFGQIRPLFYITLAVVVYAILGRERQRIRMAYQANAAAILSLILFASAIPAISFLFGGGRNGRMAGLNAFAADVWGLGVPLVMAELVRYRLVKALNIRGRASAVAICAIVLTFAFTQMNELRIFGFTDGQLMYIGFSTILPALTASAVVTYIALKGTAVAAVGVSFVYNLGATFSPVLPDVTRLVWALVTSALLFAVAMLFKAIVAEPPTAADKRLKRALRYESGRGLKMGFTLTISAFIVAFFLQLLPIYPVVILTGSMTGYIDRGSIAIMRRLPADEAYRFVSVGDVLHYHQGNIQLVHRVVDVAYDERGVREFVTKGDANPFADPMPLPQGDVIGRHMFSIPFLGYPNVLLRLILGGI